MVPLFRYFLAVVAALVWALQPLGFVDEAFAHDGPGGSCGDSGVLFDADAVVVGAPTARSVVQVQRYSRTNGRAEPSSLEVDYGLANGTWRQVAELDRVRSPFATGPWCRGPPRA